MPGINQREDVADAAVRCCLGRYPATVCPFSSSSLSIRSGKRREETRFSSVGDLVTALVQRFPVESTKYVASAIARVATAWNLDNSGGRSRTGFRGSLCVRI